MSRDSVRSRPGGPVGPQVASEVDRGHGDAGAEFTSLRNVRSAASNSGVRAPPSARYRFPWTRKHTASIGWSRKATICATAMLDLNPGETASECEQMVTLPLS